MGIHINNWSPAIGDICRVDDGFQIYPNNKGKSILYKIIQILPFQIKEDDKIRTAVILRVKYTSFYKELMKFGENRFNLYEKDKIRQLIFKTIDIALLKDSPGWDWIYEEKESYHFPLSQLKPAGRTLVELEDLDGFN